MANFQFYLEKLYDSEDFQKFIEENKNAYLCSCFFVIDKEKDDNKQHFDYFIPTEKKMFSFQVDKGGAQIPVENFDDKVPEKVSDNHNFDLKEIGRLISERMEKEGVKNKIQKILLSLQKVDGKEALLGTVFISALGMIKVRIDLDEMKVEEFEKKSFLDMLKIVKKKD